MEFSRQEYWSGLQFPTPGDLPDPGIEPTSPTLAGGSFTTSATWEVHFNKVPILNTVNSILPPVHHQLQEFTQTHVHRVGDAIQPSHPLLS